MAAPPPISRPEGMPPARSEANIGDDRSVIGSGFIASAGRVVGDRGRARVAGGDVAVGHDLHEDMADQDVVDQLGLASVDAGEALLDWDPRGEVPQLLPVALIRLVEPVPISDPGGPSRSCVVAASGSSLRSPSTTTARCWPFWRPTFRGLGGERGGVARGADDTPARGGGQDLVVGDG